MRGGIAVLAVATTLAAVASGCGGGSSEAEMWADSVCTNVNEWNAQLEQATNDVRSELQSPKAGTVAAIEADVQKAADATRQLANDLRALGAPDTDSGAQAKQQLDALATQLESTITSARKASESVPENAGLTETVKALAPLAPALSSLATSTSSALRLIQASGSDLKDGFENADSCERYR